MAKTSRRKFTSAFKAKVAIEALRERNTIQELAAKYELHPNQITTWKKEFLENAGKAFEDLSPPQDDRLQKENDDLYNRIGRLQMENEYLKKRVL